MSGRGTKGRRRKRKRQGKGKHNIKAEQWAMLLQSYVKGMAKCLTSTGKSHHFLM